MARKGKPKPSVHKFSKRKSEDEKTKHAKDEPRRERKADAEERIEAKKADVRITNKGPPKGLVGRLAAAMDKNAPTVRGAPSLRDDDDEIEVRASPKAGNPKGGVSWEDLDDLDIEDEPKGKGTPKHDDAKVSGASHIQSVPTPAGRKGTSITIDEDDGPLPTLRGKAPIDAGHKGGKDDKAHKAPLQDGIDVVTTGQNKFSLADIEALKAAIKIKGGTQVIEGINLDELKWDGDGLVPCVAQDRRTGAVLMVGWMNREVLESSLRTKAMSYWNKAHAKVQGMDEAGRHQRLVSMKVDCDKDALLAVVDQEGPACHTNSTGTCWTEQRGLAIAGFLGLLDGQIQAATKDAASDPKAAKLMAEPIQALKAFVDDANHLTKTLQGKTDDSSDSAAATLLYHMMVVLRCQGISLDKVVTELYGRHLGEQLAKGHK